MLERWFELGRRGATVGGEVRGGLTPVTYCFIKLVRRRGREVAPMMYGAALAFVVYFAPPLIQRLLPG